MKVNSSPSYIASQSVIEGIKKKIRDNPQKYFSNEYAYIVHDGQDVFGEIKGNKASVFITHEQYKFMKENPSIFLHTHHDYERTCQNLIKAGLPVPKNYNDTLSPQDMLATAFSLAVEVIAVAPNADYSVRLNNVEQNWPHEILSRPNRFVVRMTLVALFRHLTDLTLLKSMLTQNSRKFGERLFEIRNKIWREYAQKHNLVYEVKEHIKLE